MDKDPQIEEEMKVAESEIEQVSDECMEETAEDMSLDDDEGGELEETEAFAAASEEAAAPEEDCGGLDEEALVADADKHSENDEALAASGDDVTGEDDEPLLASADDLVDENGEELVLLASEHGDEVEEPAEMSPKMREMHEILPLKAQFEAAIFAAPKPLRVADLIDLSSHEVSLKEAEALVKDIQQEYLDRRCGFTLEYVKGLGYQFQTVPEAGPMMEKLFSSRPRPLSRAALETLSIIAYRQPTTRATVEFIRGVDSGSIIKNLLERDLIKCVGRKEDAGRPMIFGTTDEFLHVFGIGSLKELPPLQAFQPASETMQQAMEELDELESNEVDVEEFIADESEEMPEVSEGLLADHDGEAESADQDSAVDDSVSTEAAPRIEGATAVDQDDEQPAQPKQVSEDEFSAGDDFAEGGGAVDPEWENIH